MAITAGQTIGPYRVLEHLGQGGMATVYKAYHPRLDRMVSIKMIHQQFLDDPNFIARFEREAQIAAKLDHPHIVPVYDYAEQDGQPYIVMKFIEGASLKTVLTEAPLQPDDILHIMTGITSALDYAHKHNVLHRDVKPSNIMIDRDAVPYLTDFGLARLNLGGATTLSQDMLIGTPFYMSPEQARGDEQIDARADLYSLGIVLFELFTGTVPFSGGTPYTIIHQQISTPLPPPSQFNPDLPPAIDAFLQRALAKERDDRYHSASEMMGELRRVLAQSPALPMLPDSQPLRMSVAIASHVVRKPPSISKPTMSAGTVPLDVERPTSPLPPHGHGSTPPPARAPGRTSSKPTRRGCGIVWVAGAALALALIVLLAIIALRRLDPNGPSIMPTLASLNEPQEGGPPRPPGGERGEPPPLYTVPVLDVGEARAALDAAPEDPLAHLALFRARLAAGDMAGLGDALKLGLPYAENDAVYLLSAAAEARALRNEHAAMTILRDGLVELASTPDYPLFRDIAGAQMYEAARSTSTLDLFNLRNMNEFSEQDERTQSPIYTAMRARALITANRPALARAALTYALERSPGLPEALLVEGELLSLQGDETAARRAWQTASDAVDAPRWVRGRAQQLLQSAQS